METTDALIVFSTCSGREEAHTLARAIVESETAACVTIVPAVESIYRWQGKIENAEEFLLLVKTTRARFEALRDLIKKLHSYETPEIIAVPVAAGSSEYLAWLGAR